MPEHPTTEENVSLDKRVEEWTTNARPYVDRVWRAKWKIALTTFAVAVVAAALLLFVVEPYYETSVAVFPNAPAAAGALGALSSLASMAGVAMGGFAADAVSLDVYMTLLQSEPVVVPVLTSKYQTAKFKDSVDLIDYFEIEPDEDLSPERRERKRLVLALKEFNEDKVSLELDRQSNILFMTVEMPESALAAEVTNRLIDNLDYYLRHKRKSQAKERREYIAERISQVMDSLAEAEEALKIFRDQNRIVLTSPTLQTRQARLMRQVEVQQTIYVELVKQYELAKIDEIKDTPIVQVNQEAREPIKKAGPPRIKIMLVLIAFVSLLGAAYFAVREDARRYWRIVKGK